MKPEVAVTIASGPYARIAPLIAARAQDALGLPVKVIREGGKRAKFSLPLEQRTLFFDCDMIFLRRCGELLDTWDGWRLGAVEEPLHWPHIQEEKRKFELERYFNSGLLFLHPRHSELLRQAGELILDTHFVDQTQLNVAAQRNGWGVQWMPQRWNFHERKTPMPDTICWHYHGLWNLEPVQAQRILDEHPLQ